MIVRLILLGFLCLGLVACKENHCTNPSSCDSGNSGKQFNVTATANEGGQISPTSIRVKKGKTTSFQLSVQTGYELVSVSGCGGTLSGLTFTTGAIKSSCEVSAVFRANNVDRTAPDAKIVFPNTISKTDEKKITVRGVASDPSGVASVRVNGVAATLLKTASKNGADGTLVNWEVSLPLSYQSQVTLAVETQDTKGNVNVNASSATVLPQSVPVNFSFNSSNNTVYGFNRFNELLINELDSGIARSMPVVGEFYGSRPVYVPVLSSLFGAAVFDQDLTIYQLNTSTGIANTVLTNPLNFNTDEWLFANVTDTSYSASEDAIYFMLNYYSAIDYSLNKSVVFKFNVTTNTVAMVADHHAVDGSVIRSEALAATSQGLYVFNDFFGSGNDGLSLLSSDGAVLNSVSTAANINAVRFTFDSPTNSAYLIGFGGVQHVNLNDGAQFTLSPEFSNTELPILQPIATALDKAHNRLLVGDSSLDLVIGVDLQDGKRSIVITNGIGNGPRLIAPRELVLDSTKQLAYVLDDNLGASKSLQKIDLTTGNRSKVADISAVGFTALQDLVFDETRQLLYIAADNAVWSVDLITEQLSLISGDARGVGPALVHVTGASLDSSLQKLFITQSAEGAVLMIDVATGDRQTVSKEGEKGNGISLLSAVDIEVDETSNSAYVLSQQQGNVIKVDLITGDRSEVLANCLSPTGVDRLNPDSGSIQNLFFNKANRTLLITADALLRFDLGTMQCVPVESKSGQFNRSIFDVAEDVAGRLFTVTFNKLIQFDDKSKERVIISK